MILKEQSTKNDERMKLLDEQIQAQKGASAATRIRPHRKRQEEEVRIRKNRSETLRTPETQAYVLRCLLGKAFLAFQKLSLL